MARVIKTPRDMAITMVVLVVAVLAIVGLYGGFSFSPGHPTQGATPTADVQGGFSRTGTLLGFSVIVPTSVPADWHPNSFSLTQPPASGSSGPPGAVRGGWVTTSGTFITLVESFGTQAAVQAAEIGAIGAATGTVTASGAQWTVVPGRRSEVAWIRPAGGFLILITGNAGVADFQTLAAAVS